MQILIDIPDSLSTEKIDQIIEKIENQLKNESGSIKVERLKPRKVFAHRFEVEKIELTNREKIQRLLQWCSEHQFSLDYDVIPSREERNAR
jgi:hypothetical protein